MMLSGMYNSFTDECDQLGLDLTRLSGVYHRLLAKALVRFTPPELVLTEIPIKDLTLCSAGSDADYPPMARALKQSIADVDAVPLVSRIQPLACGS